MHKEKSNRKKRTELIKILLIALISLLLSYGLTQTEIFKSLENKVFDSLFYFRQPLEDKGQNVVIVAIDEKSITKIGNWPWPRSLLAQLIAKIKQGKPKVIGIDLLLDVPSRGQESEDEQLAEVFRTPGVCIIAVVSKEDDSSSLKVLSFKPLDIFLTDYTKEGVINIAVDPIDRATREFKPLHNRIYLSYPLAICLEYLDLGSDDVKLTNSFIEFDKYKIPVYNSRALINYKCAKIDNFSASDCLQSFFDPSFFFKDKVVLLGRTDLASKDLINTPVPSGKALKTLPMAGVEVWKEIIDMILEKNFLYRFPLLSVFLIMLLLSILISGVTSRSNKIGATALIFILALLTFTFYGLFLNNNLVMPLLQIASLCLITYLLAFLYNYFVYSKEKNTLTAAFKSYMSDQVLQDILSQKVDLRVGGKRKKLTILFADIQGFTDFADEQEPEEVLNLLKTFFSEMNKVIIDHNGIIDKLMGDGILAFFGDFTDTNHAADAVSAALEMQEKVPKLKERLGFDLVIRIGIHTGYVTVGNIGSDQHLDYTVIGKNVNLAQRLESTCDPGKILISDFTYQMIKDKVEIADSREVSLKGFARPIKVCSILKLKG